MRVILQKYWEAVQASYWFLPSIMSIGAVLLALVLRQVDTYLGSGWLEEVTWLYETEPAGARAVLSIIAGSMIGVAGVTFSITIVAVSFASGQFGPRILTNFMGDRGNQVTLGTFTATFLYCLLALWAVRGTVDLPVNGATGAEGAGTFVPHLALLGGLVLGVSSLGVLIFFIHHIPESIHISNVVAGIGKLLNHKVGKQFPERISDAEGEAASALQEAETHRLLQEAIPVLADGEGYIQHLDESSLMELAKEHNLILRLNVHPGSFVNTGKVLLQASPRGRVTDDVMKHLRSVFVWGNQRTPNQDILFLIDELVEIAVRALSPGVNDPFTAMECLDWLGSVLCNLAGRSFPGAYRYDEQGKPRVIRRPPTFAFFTEQVFGRLRPYVRSDRNATMHMLKTIASVGTMVRLASQREALQHHAGALFEETDTTLTHQDRLDIQVAYMDALKALRDPNGGRDPGG